MKKTLGILVGVLFMFILIIGLAAGTIWGHTKNAISLEEQINAQYASNKSNYDSMWKSLKEMTQVTDLQAEQFKSVYDDLISARYNDEKLLFKSIQEQNPNLDTSVYTELQRTISNNRKTFDNNQTKIADIVREYNTYIRKHPIMKAITGKNTKDINDYIVTSERTEKAFETGKDDEIKIK